MFDMKKLEAYLDSLEVNTHLPKPILKPPPRRGPFENPAIALKMDKYDIFKQDDYELMSQVHDEGEVLEKRYDGTSVVVRFRMDRARAERIKDALARKRSRRRH